MTYGSRNTKDWTSPSLRGFFFMFVELNYKKGGEEKKRGGGEKEKRRGKEEGEGSGKRRG